MTPTEESDELSRYIFNMRLHETIYFKEGRYFVQRVPGGWVYRYLDQGLEWSISAVFVPYSSEFSNGIKK